MNPTETLAESSAEEINRIRVLLRRHEFAEVLTSTEAILSSTPGDRDAQLFKAIAQRYLGRTSDAMRTLDTLERLYPNFSRLHEERGQCFVGLKRAPQAIEAFLAAVNANHALPATWSMLQGLYHMTQQPENEAMAKSHVATLRSLPPKVVTATGLFMDGDLDAAEPMVRSYLLEHGDHVEAMRLLARIGMSRKIFDDAELLLEAVLAQAPEYRAARVEYAEVLIELHKHSQARRVLEQLLLEDPANRIYYQTLLASSLVGLGEHERAIELYRELLDASPRDADLHLSVAHALKTLGRSSEAIESYRRAAASRPGFGDAYWSLANLKTYRFTDEELLHIRELQTASNMQRADRYHLHFALGKALEDRDDFADAFHCYTQGNALKRAESNYRPEIIEYNTRQQIQVCTADFFSSRQSFGAPDPDPIFIIGLPRAGSTLLEQILASHSQVEGTQELPNIQQIVGHLRGRDPDTNDSRYPRILGEISLEDSQKLAQQYLDATRVYRIGKPQPVPFFIDKMPNNFRHLGLIRLMLPRAKIIDARREPLACCFSNLKQLFAKGQEFTYSVDDIARYYKTYLELMKHWDTVLPGWILRVNHEDVVGNLDGSIRRILNFCGLEFQPECLEFYKTSRSVRTASSEQVRQPIYREGLHQWKKFEAWLGPLKDALGDALVSYRNE